MEHTKIRQVCPYCGSTIITPIILKDVIEISKITAWKCVMCGDVFDDLILHRRKNMKQACKESLTISKCRHGRVKRELKTVYIIKVCKDKQNEIIHVKDGSIREWLDTPINVWINRILTTKSRSCFKIFESITECRKWLEFKSCTKINDWTYDRDGNIYIIEKMDVFK